MENLNALIRQKPTELVRRLLRTERDVQRVEDLLSEIAAARQFHLDATTLAIYVSHLAELDADRYADGDVTRACKKFVREPRGEFETQFPTLGELLERIDNERRLRTQDAVKAACEDRMAKLLAFAEAERMKREAEWNERTKARAVSSATR